MRLVFHGGLCCGMKTIYGFNSDPEAMEPAKSVTISSNQDQHGYHVSSDIDFYHPAAPEESRIARLDRYLEFLDGVRPRGICEVILADSKIYGTRQLDEWRPILEERGYREVSNCKNSNSGNRIYVFHRCKE